MGEVSEGEEIEGAVLVGDVREGCSSERFVRKRAGCDGVPSSSDGTFYLSDFERTSLTKAPTVGSFDARDFATFSTVIPCSSLKLQSNHTVTSMGASRHTCKHGLPCFLENSAVLLLPPGNFLDMVKITVPIEPFTFCSIYRVHRPS